MFHLDTLFLLSFEYAEIPLHHSNLYQIENYRLALRHNLSLRLVVDLYYDDYGVVLIQMDSVAYLFLTKCKPIKLCFHYIIVFLIIRYKGDIRKIIF